MRFGIMAMQLQSLVPTGRTPQEITANLGKFSYAAHVESLHTHGFNPIELGGDLVLFFPHTYEPPAIAGLARLAREQDIQYTVHLPLWSVEPSTPLAPVRTGSTQALIDCIRATESLDPGCYVVHATGALATEFYRRELPEQTRALILRQFQAGAMRSLEQVLAETGIPSRKIAVETIEFPLDLTLEITETLDLSICLDTGHVLSGFPGDLGVMEVLELCLPRLVEIHLHDSPAHVPGAPIVYHRDHSLLGTGDLDVAAFLQRLQAAGFAGPLIFELNVKQALASLEVIRAKGFAVA